jgi:SAM-dependent methyltransferase
VRRAANAWDRFYRQHEAPWRGERRLADLRPWLGAGRVLELGCGNGKTLRPLVAAGHAAVGLDVSWHALRRLRAVPRVVGDASALPFRDAMFACVLDIHCTAHLNPAARAAALREVRRVLAPGGHLVLERLGVGDLRAGQGAAVVDDDGARRLADGRTTHFSDEPGLHAETEAAGLRVMGSKTMRRTQRLGARAARRESVRVVAERPVAFS